MYLFSSQRIAETRAMYFCPTTLEFGGKQYRALMKNLSTSGAGFETTVNGNYPPVNRGDELTLDIKTPYGSSKVRGVVRWAQQVQGHRRWGLEFTAIPVNEQDPIRCLIDSPM
jgi:hypothetical protein